MATYGVVLITASSQSEAETIAHRLLQGKLAACVTILPVQSIYIWQDSLHNDPEWQLIVKTDLDQFDALAATVKTVHSYDVPEIIALPVVAGFQPYLDWIGAQVSQHD
ncbi:MAG: divalent-cation tolerance protein CutA [Cyanobacteria bacterium]|nr:divalent-cation tolerance protein CutA [Cyanobacteriota bacterium]MDW8200486.1 divalent-cation tolerance protein CutA [Cyanobacteriota bacterium SKYGB_h_bin112]